MSVKETKAAKAARLDGRHKYVIGAVADLIGIEAAVVEEGVLEGEQLDDFDLIFASPDGVQTLMFFYNSKSPKNKRIIITDGTTEPLSEQCVFVVRTLMTKPITTSNMAAELNFGIIKCPDEKGGLLSAVRSLIADVYAPFLRSTESWGTGAVVPEAEQKEAFLETLDKFQNSLSDAYVAINDSVELKKFVPAAGDKAFHLDRVRGPQDYGTYAENPDVIGQLEALLDSWCKQIEQVLAESEQMRKEADDVGPRAELEHWKRRMAKFNGLLEQIKSPTCTSTVGILHQGKSRLLDEWRRLDTRITEEANEAKDNVKYLYTLDKFCEPLYKCTPVCSSSLLVGRRWSVLMCLCVLAG